MWPKQYYLSVFSRQLPGCLSQSSKCFLKMLFELYTWGEKVLLPDWGMKMHSPNKQKHTAWHILSNIMNHPMSTGTEGFSCVIISCSVLVTQAALMYHVEFEYEFQSHDYLLLLLPVTFPPPQLSSIAWASYWS